MQLRKATRKKSKLRLGLSAVSGAGKTYSALLIASGMTTWDKIALIDTENGSGDLYSHLGAYNVLTLQAPFTPEKYIEAIKTCEQSGMEVVIVDSITHEWDGKGGILEIHGKMTGNSFTNWATVNPRHTAFINSILESPCHMITTVRRKQEYEMGKDGNGKAQVTKLGMKEVTREGWEYEVTANLELDINHNASSSKDRTGLFDGKPAFTASAETGKMLLDWCNEGVEVVPEIVDLPILTKEDPMYSKVVEALKNKSRDMDYVRSKFRLSDEVESELFTQIVY